MKKDSQKTTASSAINISPSEKKAVLTDELYIYNILGVQNENKKYFVNISTQKTISFPIPGNIFPNRYFQAFSPDKKWILFYKDNNMWKISTDGKTTAQITTQGKADTKNLWGMNVGGGTWSPDGKHIYYFVSSNRPGNDAVYPGMEYPDNMQEGVWIIKSDGGNPLYTPQVKYPIAWMPDSTKIIFTGSNDEKTGTKTFDIINSAIAVLLPDTLIKDISWSLDGKKAVYTDSPLDNSYLIDENFKVLDTVIRQKDIIPFPTPNSSVEFTESHMISPNGNYAILSKLFRPSEGKSGEFDANLKVYLWDTKTYEKKELPIHFSIHTKPYWTQDSKKIVYLKQEVLEDGYIAHAGDFYVYDIASQKATKLTKGSKFWLDYDY